MLPIFNSCNGGREKVDSRWKAMVDYAPWGQELNVHSAKALSHITVSSLYVSGDYDDVSGYELGVKRLFEPTGGKDTFLLVYENARHNIAPILHLKWLMPQTMISVTIMNLAGKWRA